MPQRKVFRLLAYGSAAVYSVYMPNLRLALQITARADPLLTSSPPPKELHAYVKALAFKQPCSSVYEVWSETQFNRFCGGQKTPEIRGKTFPKKVIIPNQEQGVRLASLSLRLEIWPVLGSVAESVKIDTLIAIDRPIFSREALQSCVFWQAWLFRLLIKLS